MHIGCCDFDPADQPGFLVGRDMRFVAVHGFPTAVPSPACLVVASDTGRRDHGRIDQCARAHHDPVLIELARDDLEQRSVKPTPHQLASEAHKGGALRRRLTRGKTAEPPKAGAIVERLSQTHV
jgi:hypothetical protein